MSMKNQKLLFLLTLLLFTSSIFAQITITGKILDEAGFPLPGANIIELGTQNGVTTDFDGNFKLKTKSDTGKITVSFIGYKNQELIFSPTINEFKNLQLVLSNDLLNEVVLIGYGEAKRNKITTAVGTAENIKTINSRPVANLNDFLQGNIAGVTVLQNGGDPSRESLINIRGVGSVNLSNPLRIVDGSPYYGPAINPNDIESVSILKDAAAAAIYGVQAGNGVIVIKTKKGRLGKPVLNLNISGGIQTASNLPTALNAKQQADTYNLAADNAGATRLDAHDATKNPWGQITRTNWVNSIFRSAEFKNINATLSGASKKANYMMSGGYFSKEGVLVGTKYDRYSLRVKSEYDLFDNFTIGENLYFSRTNAVGANTNSGYSGSIINAIYMPSAAPIYDEQGKFHGVAPFNLEKFAGAYGDVYNPVALLLRPTTKNPTNFINANIFGEYEIANGLKVKSSFTYNLTDKNHKRFQPKVPELGRTNKENSLIVETTDKNLWTWENQIDYTKSFGFHNLGLTAVYSAQKSSYEYNYTKGTDFDREDAAYQYLGNAGSVAKKDIDFDANEVALTSATARLMYDFDGRYLFAASIRRDESSKPVGDKQVDYFPSVSLGWNIAKESFFNVNAVNNLKLRASWGQLGNLDPVSPYRSAPIKNTTVNIGEDGKVNDRGTYQGKITNANLLWEKIQTLNVGIDASFLDNKITFIADYFRKNTKDMVLEGLEDPNIGTDSDFVNGGEVLNEGLEFTVGYNDKFGDLGFRANANTSILMNNEVLNLNGYNNSGIDYIVHSDNVRSTLNPFRSAVGQPLYSYYLIPYQGIFQNQAEVDAHALNGNKIQPNAKPGDLKFQDTNNDGKINDEDRVYMGNYFPNVTYNLGLNFDYKGIDLGFLFQGVAGSKAFNAYKYTTYNAALQGYNLDNRVVNAWTPQNTNTDIPRVSLEDNNANFSTNSSWYLEDADYVRLKNLSLGYTFDSEKFSWIKSSSLRVYFSADNVFTLTNYSGIDPEIGSKGLDVGNYPLPRIYSAGISLKL